jgi:glycosyltransferase involved in cell wall biosynthesis
MVSVVIATYNRSNVLAFALESLRRQGMRDWEAWVVGDACSDDTESVVRGLGDTRIHFLNLEHNVGEQSGPNNEGARRARGRYVAYLNHDDLWFPDHLETAVHAIEQTGADMVYTLLDQVKFGEGRWRPHRLCGVGPGLRFDPRTSVPASCWLMRRELVEEIGPWRFYRECRLVPSEDWIYRAWRAGKDIRAVPVLTVLAFPSGRRANSYAERQDSEQRRFLAAMDNADALRARQLSEIAVGYRMYGFQYQRARSLLREVLVNLGYRLSMKLGRHPFHLRYLLAGVERGARVDAMRRMRGLPRLADRGDRTDGSRPARPGTGT